MLASQALMKPMQMSVKIRTICRRYEKRGASHRSRRHNTKVVNLSGGVIRQSAWRFAPKRAEFGTVGRSPDGRACRDRRPLAQIGTSQSVRREGISRRSDTIRPDASQLDLLFDDDAGRQRRERASAAIDGLIALSGRTVISLSERKPPAGGHVGGKIPYTRIPS